MTTVSRYLITPSAALARLTGPQNLGDAKTILCQRIEVKKVYAQALSTIPSGKQAISGKRIDASLAQLMITEGSVWTTGSLSTPAVKLIGIEIDRDDVDELAAELRRSAPPAPVTGGRRSGPHGEVVARATIKLLQLDDAQLRRQTVDSLSEELGPQYIAAGGSKPDERNRKSIASSILREVRKARESGFPPPLTTH